MADPVELMARPLCRHDGYGELPMWDHYLPETQAALSALDASGFAVVLKTDLQAWLDRPAHGWVAARERIAAQVKS